MPFTKPYTLPYNNTGDRKASTHRDYLLELEDAFDRAFLLLLHLVGPTPAQDGLIKFSDVQSNSGLIEERSVPNMTVLCNKALGMVDGRPFYVDGPYASSVYGNGTFVAPSSLDRIDTVSINPSTQQYVFTTGTEATSPSAPATPADHLKVAEVYLRPGMTAIYDTDTTGEGYITTYQTFFAGSLPPGLADEFNSRLSIITESENAGVDSYTYGGTNGIASYNTGAANGTEASPTIVSTDQIVWRGAGAGHDGSVFSTCGRIDISVDGTPGSGDMPGKISFATNQGSTVYTAMVIDSLQQAYFFNRPVVRIDENGSNNGGMHSECYGTISSDLRKVSFNGQVARGTLASPAIVQDADVAYRLLATCYDGAAYRTLAHIDYTVDGTPGSGDMPGRIDIFTTPNGSSTPVLRASFRENGIFEPVKQARYANQATLTTTGAVSWSLLDDPCAKMNALSGNVTLTITDISVNCNGRLYVKQDGSTAYTITWPGTVKWAGGTAPDLSTLGSDHYISFESYDGTNLVGAFLEDFS